MEEQVHQRVLYFGQILKQIFGCDWVINSVGRGNAKKHVKQIVLDLISIIFLT